MENEKLLHEEIRNELEALKEMEEIGTETYKVTVDGLSKLLDRAIEIDKLNIEATEKEKAREEAKESRQFEQTLKVEQMEDEKRDRWIKNGLTAVNILTSLGLVVWGTNKSLKFEETGTVTTIMGRGFLNKILPKK